MSLLAENIYVVLAVIAVVLVGVIIVGVISFRRKPVRRDPMTWSDFVADHDRKQRRR